MTRLAAVLLAVLAAPAAAGTITIKGSDTLVGLSQRWARAFSRKHPDITVQITGGGSGTGLAALESGATDIATSSHPLGEEEQARLAAKLGHAPIVVPVVRDSVAFFVNAKNPVRALSLEQLRDVLLGDVARWSAFGGPDRQIITYTRESTSGTYGFVKERVLHDEDFASTLQPLEGTGAVVNAVSHEPWAMGFGGTAFARNVRVLAVRIGDEEVLPTSENVMSGKYPLSRQLYFYVPVHPSADTAAFLEFVRSPEGQAIADRAGFLPLQ